MFLLLPVHTGMMYNQIQPKQGPTNQSIAPQCHRWMQTLLADFNYRGSQRQIETVMNGHPAL